MATFIIYAIRWAVTLTLLYSLYRLLLQHETFHRLNRAVLLAILVVSPLLPLVPLHTDEPTAMDSVLTRIEEPLMSLSSDANNADATFVAQESEGATSGLWLRYGAYIYIIGIAVALATYLFRMLSLVRVIRRSRRIDHPMVPERVHLMLDMRITQPSSWMHWIFIGPVDLKQNAEAVLRHELAHVRLKHSWDVVLCDLTCRLLWCLPFAWMLRQDMVDVHEFQADEAVLRGGVTLDEYEHLLVRKAVQTQVLPIMNTLRRGALKKRFAMMHSGPSPRWSRLKLLYLVPALAACLWVSAQAEEYNMYLNGNLVTQKELVAIDPSTIKHVDVIHSQKKVFVEAATEPVDTGGVMPGVKPEDAYFDMVEQMPQFPGGDAAFNQYMAQHVRYPKVATENGVEGTVTVQFIVEADGRITHVQAVDSPSDEADAKVYAYGTSDKQPSEAEDDEGRRALREAAEELFRGMPPFEPGRQSGKPVRVQMTKKVSYALR
jgi:beta-lactamase regulating signal transducer with metallopeptidase domain